MCWCMRAAAAIVALRSSLAAIGADVAATWRVYRPGAWAFILGRYPGGSAMAAPLPAEVQSLLSVRRILVPCDGSEVAFAALALACDVAKRNGGQVYAVHVIIVRRSLPLDAEMGPETARGNSIGKQLGIDVQSELLQARDAGTSIVDEAADLDVDAIFLGLELKERI